MEKKQGAEISRFRTFRRARGGEGRNWGDAAQPVPAIENENDNGIRVRCDFRNSGLDFLLLLPERCGERLADGSWVGRGRGGIK
jgi:hypothetical protein